MPVLVDNDGDLVELGEGRGNLATTSQPFTMDGGAGSPFFGGRPVSFAKIFATQPWVGIAVMRLLTWSVRVPLKVYRRLGDDGERVRVRPADHPLARAVAAPWDRGCMADLTMSQLGPLCVQGNALTDVIEGAGGQIRFDPIDWRTVTPIRADYTDPNGEILGWKIYEHGTPRERSADTVMHLKWWSPLGNIGISPLQQLRSTLTSEKAAVEWTINNLRNSARPSGVVETGDELLKLSAPDRQQTYDQAVEDLRKHYAGTGNAGKLPVLPPGMKWTTSPHTTAVEAELMAQRIVNRLEVAATYQLPPTAIAQLERSTFSNIVEMRQMGYTDGLAPPLVFSEQIINAHVVEGLLREDDIFVEYDFAGILRGDRLKEVQALRESIGSALLTPNEGRDVVNLPRSKSPEADKLYLPTNNLRAIDEESDLGEVSLAAQRASQAAGGPVMDREEARALIGLGADGQAGDSSTADEADTQTAGDTAAAAEKNGHHATEVHE